MIRFLFFFFIITATSCYAQNSYNLPPESFYEKASIGFKDFSKKEVVNLLIQNDSIGYDVNGHHFTKAYSEINYIRISEGNKVGKGALLGGASGLVISLSTLAQYSNNDNIGAPNNPLAVTLIATGIGTGIGALVGILISKKKSYYVHASK